MVTWPPWLAFMAVKWSESSQSQATIRSFLLATGNCVGSAQGAHSRNSFIGAIVRKYVAAQHQGPPHLEDAYLSALGTKTF